MWLPLAKKYNHFRTELLGLESLDLTEGGKIIHNRQLPYMYCWSPTVLPKPSGMWIFECFSNYFYLFFNRLA